MGGGEVVRIRVGLRRPTFEAPPRNTGDLFVFRGSSSGTSTLTGNTDKLFVLC